MRVVSITLENFKSYRGTTVVGPFDEFSCIIGPNGSGKSNITEALCFALCSPTKSLRADCFQDLICKGEGMCSVAVTTESRVFYRAVSASSSTATYKIDGESTNYERYTEVLLENNILHKMRNFAILQADAHKLCESKNLAAYIDKLSSSFDTKSRFDECKSSLGVLEEEFKALNEAKKRYLSTMKENKDSTVSQKKLQGAVKGRDKLLDELEIAKSALYHERHKQLSTSIASCNKKITEGEEALFKLDQAYGTSSKAVAEQQERILLMESEINELVRDIKENYSVQVEVENYKTELRYLNAQMMEKKDNIDKVTRGYEFFQEVMLKEQETFRELDLYEYAPDSGLLEKKEIITDSIMSDKLRLAEMETERESLVRTFTQAKEQNARRLKDIEAVHDEKRKQAEVIQRYTEELEQNKEYISLEKEEKVLNAELETLLREIIAVGEEEKSSRAKIRNKAIVDTLKRKFSGVYGRIVDLITPLKKSMEAPLSTLLGSNENGVVVDNEAVAYECIKYLREEKLGVFRFFPLNKVKGEETASINSPNLSVSRVVDTIRYEESIKGVVNYIFKDNFICEKAEDAAAIVYKQGMRVKICTMENIVFNKNGTVTTFPTRNCFSGSLSDLLVKKEALVGQIDVIRVCKKKYPKLEVIVEKIGEGTLQLERLTAKEGNIQVDIARTENFLKKIEDKCAAVDEEVKLLKQEIQGPLKEIEEIEQGLDAGMREAYRPFLEKRQLAFKKLKDLLRDKVLAESRVREKKIRFDAMKEDLEGSMANISSRIEFITSKMREVWNRGTMSTKEQVSSARIDELSRLKEICKNDKLELLGVEKSRREVADSLKACLIEKSKSEAELEMLAISLPPTKEVAGASYRPVDELQELLAAVEAQIEELTPKCYTGELEVNEVDLEDFQSKKRTMFRLRHELTTLRKERTERFMSCFEAINQMLAECYRDINGCGAAHLVCVNQSDPFDAPIKFYVMVGGKRYREIGDLSGGERAVATFALLVALARWKGPGFIVLDEIDANLDRDNSRNVCDYLRRLDIQVIAVSLRLKFFSRSDALIGVYKRDDRSHILTYSLR